MHARPRHVPARCFSSAQVIKNKGDQGAVNIAAGQAAEAARNAANQALQQGKTGQAVIDAARQAGQQAAQSVSVASTSMLRPPGGRLHCFFRL